MKNIKKYNIVFILFFLSVISSFSQEKKITYGGKIGICNSTFAQDFQGYGNHKTGFTIGAFVSYRVTDYFYLSIEANYLQQGAANVYLDTSSSISNLTFHEIDIPVLLNFNLPNFDKITPKIFIGHSFGFNVNVTSKNRIPVLNEPLIYVKSSYNITQNYDLLDFAGVVGLGVDFKYEKMLFSVDARYRIGYTNMTFSSFNKISFNNISVNIGVGF